MFNRTLAAIRHNLVAWLALFVALGGTSLAAKHYVITSTKQINPKVLKSLTGQNGRNGATGPTGVAGPAGTSGTAGAKGESGETGPKGATGPEGPLIATLPSGKTERGAYGLVGTRASGLTFAPATETSYPIPLPFTPTINVIKEGGAPTARCPGSEENPTAAAGNLCIYEQREDCELQVEYSPANGQFGFLAFAEAAEGANYEEVGDWAVTAP